MMVRVRGSYALALMFTDYPGEIYAARKDSPMVLGTADGESFLASDVPALLKYTRDIYYIEDLHSVRILPGELHFFDLNGDEVEVEQKHITWDAEAAEKGGYEHFMIKEIHEQPKAIRDTLNSVINDRSFCCRTHKGCAVRHKRDTHRCVRFCMARGNGR